MLLSMPRLFFLACCMFIFFTAGCATLSEPPVDQAAYHKTPWKQRRMNLADLQNWWIQGAVSIQCRGKTDMATFNWKQLGDHYTITLYGPLNLGCISLQGCPGQVTLIKPMGSTFSASSAEQLMQRQLGWYLPVSNMYYWVRGLPAPGSSAKQIHDQYGHLVFLGQQGWMINFQAYQSQGNMDLPRKIILDNQALHVKLVISNWNLQ